MSSPVRLGRKQDDGEAFWEACFGVLGWLVLVVVVVE